MAFKLEFETSNDAFEQDMHGEITRILKLVASQVDRGSSGGRILDVNGNTVGSFYLERA